MQLYGRVSYVELAHLKAESNDETTHDPASTILESSGSKKPICRKLSIATVCDKDNEGESRFCQSEVTLPEIILCCTVNNVRIQTAECEGGCSTKGFR